MFIKKIFQNNADESVHRQFVRFGKGTFENRAIINVKKISGIAVSTSFELANELVEFISMLAPKFKVQGIVLSRQPLSGFEGRKKAGVFEYQIEKEMGSDELKKLSECYASLLDCSSNGIELKMKKKLPRPKPSASGTSRASDKFCQLNLDACYWPQFHDEFLFDLPREIKKARIEHSYIIESIVIPKELEKRKDFEKVRQEARKKGKLIRKAVVDGKEFLKEATFVV